MAYWLDYSAARLDGPTIRNAGYAGAIRYVGGTSTKHTTAAEYNSIKAAGLGFLAVMEVNTGDANGGYAQGVAYAQRAKAHCDQLGYGGVIFFCNDTPSLPSASLWDDYLTGAASVLGWDRVGAYGFANAMDVARNATPCRYFWLAGSSRGIAPRPYLNFWQDNNTQVTVGGITCDRNLVLKDITPTGGFLMALSDDQQLTMYNRVMGFLKQRWYVVKDGTPVEVGAATPGAQAAAALDTLDGNYLVRRIQDVEAKVAAPAPPPVDLTDAQLDALADKVAARLKMLRFDSNPQ